MYVRHISEFSLCFYTLNALWIIFSYFMCINNLHLPKDWSRNLFGSITTCQQALVELCQTWLTIHTSNMVSWGQKVGFKYRTSFGRNFEFWIGVKIFKRKRCCCRIRCCWNWYKIYTFTALIAPVATPKIYYLKNEILAHEIVLTFILIVEYICKLHCILSRKEQSTLWSCVILYTER